jgi:hypothetical protein
MKGKLVHLAAAVPTLLATLYTESREALAVAASHDQGLGLKPIASTTIKQEAVQILRLGPAGEDIQINVAGEAGVHFRVLVSATGEPGSFMPIDGGTGVLAANGFASLTLHIAATERTFLIVHASDGGGFSGEFRTTGQPLELGQGSERQLLADDDDWSSRWSRNSSMGVRG